MYADKITDSMAQTIEETARRREKQEAYNAEHGLVPVQVKRTKKTVFEQSELIEDRPSPMAAEPAANGASILADPVVAGYVSRPRTARPWTSSWPGRNAKWKRPRRSWLSWMPPDFRDELFALQEAVKDWPA